MIIINKVKSKKKKKEMEVSKSRLEATPDYPILVYMEA